MVSRMLGGKSMDEGGAILSLGGKPSSKREINSIP